MTEILFWFLAALFIVAMGFCALVLFIDWVLAHKEKK